MMRLLTIFAVLLGSVAATAKTPAPDAEELRAEIERLEALPDDDEDALWSGLHEWLKEKREFEVWRRHLPLDGYRQLLRDDPPALRRRILEDLGVWAAFDREPPRVSVETDLRALMDESGIETGEEALDLDPVSYFFAWLGYHFRKLMGLVPEPDLRPVTQTADWVMRFSVLLAGALLVYLALRWRKVGNLELPGEQAEALADLSAPDQAQARLERALAAGDYAGALNACYGWAIARLSESGAIYSAPGMTDADYLREILLTEYGRAHGAPLLAWTRRHQRTRYGLRGVNAEEFTRFRRQTEALVDALATD